MSFKEYASFDGVGLGELVRRREVSPKELLDEALARTARIDPQINAVVVKHYDYAERQIEKTVPDGPFAGVPFLLKDLEYLGGTRTTFGASILKAAAVAARILPVAHASDGGGSIRIPASACGVFGMKPTRARMPLGPDRGEGWGGFSCNHVVSISVRDSAVMMDVLGGPEPTSIYHAPPPERPYSEEIGREPGRLRIAFTDKHTYGDAIDPEVAQAVRDVAGMLEKLGHRVEESAPEIPANGPDVMGLIVSANVAQSVRMVERGLGRAVTDADFEGLTLAMVRNAQKSTSVDYVDAQTGAFKISRALYEFFTSCDVFLSPTLCRLPLRLGELNSMSSDFSLIPRILRSYIPGTAMFNMSGQPAMSVPLAWSRSGLPIGMMFAARFGDEATLFRLAAQLEQERPWKAKLPPVCA